MPYARVDPAWVVSEMEVQFAKVKVVWREKGNEKTVSVNHPNSLSHTTRTNREANFLFFCSN